MSILEIIATQVIGEPVILFAIVALIGLILLKKPIEDVVVGVAKTMIGFLILTTGADLLTAVVTPIAAWINAILGVEGVQPTMWAVLSTGMAEYGSVIGTALLIGFALNLLLARITPLKGVNITGHIMLLFAAWATTFLAGFGLGSTALVIVAGVFCALQYWLTPSIIRHFMKDKLTADYSLCMPNVSGIALTSWLSPLIGDPRKNFQDIEVPDRLNWVRDSVVSIAIFGSVLWFALGLLAGPAVVAESTGGQNWIIFLILHGVKFSAGVAVVLYGVRMLLGEIVPAFQGIAKRVIPGAVLALDYPTVYHFSPTAVFVGFFSKLFGAIVGTLLQLLAGLPVIVLPSVFMDFWDGALLGVFADKFGGRRAALLVPFLVGIVVQFIWALAYPHTGGFLTANALAMDYPDTGFISLILGWIMNLFS